MEPSFLYHSFGISRSYQYHATEYKDNAIILKLKSFSLKKVKCPHCGGYHIIKYGVIHRKLHNLPIGKKTFFSLTIQRYLCKDCKKVFQADIPFTHGNVSYTYLEKRKLIKGTRWMLLSKNLDKYDEAARNRFENILPTNERFL